nr:zinc finger, CCHC-type [Tanacetum cinerariifolium]
MSVSFGSTIKAFQAKKIQGFNRRTTKSFNRRPLIKELGEARTRILPSVGDFSVINDHLDKFEGHDFRRWQKKMHFLLTTLKVVYVLTTPMPELLEDATVEAIRIRAKNVESAKELWDSLESNYMAEDSSSKKFLYNELLRILGQYTQHGLKKHESISVSSIIDKLTPSWKDFKHTLKHGKDGLSLVQLGSHLRIEESLRVQDSNKGKGKEKCGKTGHFKRDCRSGKKNNANAGGLERGLRTNPKTKVDAIAWWIDSSATTHVCIDRCWFKTYEPVEDGSVLYMGNDHFAHVHGKGSVALEFSSGKTITLFNVLYVPKLHKNLVSGPMLNKCGYKQVYESDKYILSKSGVFVGFGYYNNGMFMLNLNKVPDDSESVYMCSFTVVNSSLWHARLGHVHYKRMLEMSKDDLIHAIDENLKKCTTCMLTKITRKPFQSITRKSVILELIHSDLCDSHATPSLDNKKPKDIIPNSDESQRDDHSDDVPNEIPEPRKVDKTKKFLSSRFSMKDMGEADVILGIKIKRKIKGIVITQSHYIEKILKKFNREDCSLVSTFMDSVEKLKLNTGKLVDQLEYSRAIGCLMYAMTSTRSDIAYAVGRLSRFTSNPSRQHWKAITRVFKYLRGTMNYGLSFIGYPSVLEAYSDASWINHAEDSSSTSGCVFLLGGCVISWASK